MGLKLSKSSDHDDALSTSTSLLRSPAVQDSHFVLELVRKADENVYPCDVEPTLAFIVQETGVIVLNNDQGFTVESIKALCDDVCSSRHIAKKGIGFKSVFRVTEAPEIHSNVFHIKFNISNGLPKLIPPRDISLFCKTVALDNDPTDEKCWNTCIILPKKNEELAVDFTILMFPKLHPWVMLFLHRLECIKYRIEKLNLLVVMRKEVVGDGVVNIFRGEQKETWFVKNLKLRVDHIDDHDVQTTTEISIAFLLEGLSDVTYTPNLVFASLLPLSCYYLKFIIQADFIVSSSREDVEEDNPWNQWLLNKLPNLFVSAEYSFCSLPCFKENPAKGVSVFLSFVPLEDAVEGFFSCLTHMIISKLRVSNCLLLEGDDNEWVRPCKVVRNWTEETRSLLPDSLIREHLDVGYLNKDTVLTDSLAQALSIQECGPEFLVRIMVSLCRAGSLKLMGLSWLSSWLNLLFMMLVNQPEYDIICSLSQLPFIPLLDGSYASISTGTIWMHTNEHGFKTFGKLNPKLRFVNPALFSDHVENITEMLYKLGVQRLSAHGTLIMHVLPALCDKKIIREGKELMIEYLSFTMVHLESGCSECRVEKEQIVTQLSNNAYVSTNYGYVRLADVAVHFSEEFGNPIDMSKLVGGTNMKWVEIDIGYLRHPVYRSASKALSKWRNFLMELGVTDFVKIVKSEKSDDWDSQELMHLLSHVSSNGDKEKGVCLLKVLNTVWDDYFSDKPYKGYVIRILRGVRWLASSMDDQLHYPKDLFHNCETVREVLGHRAPYTVPKVSNQKLLDDIGLKYTITLDDALSVLGAWRRSKKTLRASITQMSKFYTYLSNEMSISKKKISKNLRSQAFIFVPSEFSNTNELVCGLLLSPSEVCWDDSTGLMEQTKSNHPQFYQYNKTKRLFSIMLINIYPGLHDFFVNDFGVVENPPLLSYLQPLLQLSNGSLPSLTSKTVFQVFRKWSDGLDSGIMSCDDINYLKKSMQDKKMRILPTSQYKWVSLNQSVGLICWCDDEQLRKEFMKLKNVNILRFWELTTREKRMLRNKVSVLFCRLGIPSLPEVVTREAIWDNVKDNTSLCLFINWFLPYAQRYIYSFHRNDYYSEFKNLKIVLVEKLFYKNVIKKFGIESNKRIECSCLLQDNILYATPEYCSDLHSLFMELSRFLVSGVPNLPLANFLHMIATTESGSIEEQIKLFLKNKQKLITLPSEESKWSIVTSTTAFLSPRKSVPKKRSRRKTAPCVESTSTSEQVDSVILNTDEGLTDQSDSRICTDIVPFVMNDGLNANERELVASSSSKPGTKWVKKVKELRLGCDIVDESKENIDKDELAKQIIECIRREEFGLDSNTAFSFIEENDILEKQCSRLDETLHSLSQELYSRESNFLLEIVQNADENVYPCDVEPTLTFILQEKCIIILNNDQGFSVEKIKALCDVSNSKEMELSARHIGKKAIGFKSVFKVTDAPEIHSNGFHIKFDISQSQIGFFLPTLVPPRDLDVYSKLVNDPVDPECNNTCMIMLPLRLNNDQLENIFPMFSILDPSILLFLHRLDCIKIRNILNDSLVVIRKQVAKHGVVNVFLGNERITWFVKSRTLQLDSQTTEISVALMLEDLGNGDYISKLDQQPVFAFFPLRGYGLKFIIQADFSVSWSTREVDQHSQWNQWLLTEFPNFFVNAELSFCSLPCFKKNPAKGVSVFMSFVPLVGEVDGFFSQLPDMIISKLRVSSCLLLQGDDNEWVPPCKVVRNWSEQTRSLLPDSLIMEHLDVGYLNKDTVLTDPLARALGVEECGPKVLIQVMASLCRADSLKSMGLGWLSSWLNALFLMLVNETDEYNFISSLSQQPMIPLLDGSYVSTDEGTIWLHTDPVNGFEAFGKVYASLRIVNPALFDDQIENVTQMLYKFGVRRLSAHDVLKSHVLPAICDEKDKDLMIAYLSFIMFHLELSCCIECLFEKEHILLQLRNNAFISTNQGFKRLVDVPIHFGKEFGNPVDMSKLVNGSDMKWVEIDISYLKHPVNKDDMSIWRKFLIELGVTDFVQINKCTKSDDDWDSQELMHLLSHVSSNGARQNGVCLLKVLDTVWDDYFSEKPYKGYVIKILHGVRWLASSMDDQLHFPKDLFHNCENVREVLGHKAPYTAPKVNSVKFIEDIGLKKTITLYDALSILDVWRASKKPFRARISQMSKFYTYLCNAMSVSKQKIVKILCSKPFIFVPDSFEYTTNEVVSGLLLSPSDVFWHDSTGSMKSSTLSAVYPDLRYFFVNKVGVTENPPLLSYLRSLLQLSTENSPSMAAKTVFQVFKKWSDGLDSGALSSDDVDYLKKSMEEKETTIIPTVKDKWVSLHQSFGNVFWCDDEHLRNEFGNLNNIDFLSLGELTNEEKQMLQDKVSVLLRKLGIHFLTEIVTREVVHDGPKDNSYIISLVNWALPYAQRYIYNIHPNEYYQLKLSGFRTLHALNITVVDKLFYTYVIKRFGVKSNNPSECSCLLHDNTLYAARKFDDHSLFIELSRLLLAGIPEFHFANFLHVITTMAKSGFTEVKMEEFVTNSQKLPNLPSEESQWSLASTSSSEAGSRTAKKLRKNSSWPPVHWKTGPVLIPDHVGLFDSISDPNMLDSVIDMNVFSSDTPQNMITGRIGESEAFKYFSAEFGEKRVTWVNEVKETGYPYDILVEGKDNNEKEYIEVKSTSKANKDWFNISLNEWLFAVEKGESFSIARVVLSDKKPAKITTFKDPAKLCRSKQLYLAIHPSK
ncbi:protein NO VEIN-like [Rutidosis leptorrhynchoides]|uniref:protein NO VEIN-like n=1 Tax=Rutidosis leptorrhynchoides TaxID=125765 RepID=UPI003A99871E